MPVRSITNEMDVVPALAPIKSKQPGVTNSLLYSGSRFVGHQKSKGNQYDVEVILQVRNELPYNRENNSDVVLNSQSNFLMLYSSYLRIY